MESFQYIKPHPLLAPYIKYYWCLKSEQTVEMYQRVIPTGSNQLIFHRGGYMLNKTENEKQPLYFMSGQLTLFTDLKPAGKVDMISITFKPHGAACFFSFPMHELRNQEISFDLLPDKGLKDLQERIKNTYDNNQAIQLIESYFLKKIQLADEYNFQRISASIHVVNSKESDIKKLADISCLSYKQFQRVFSEQVGLNPKDFIKIVRFQRALYYLQHNRNISLTHLALDSGYYDQSHMIKDFKKFSGYTPSEYLKQECIPFSDYFFTL